MFDKKSLESITEVKRLRFSFWCVTLCWTQKINHKHEACLSSSQKLLHIPSFWCSGTAHHTAADYEHPSNVVPNSTVNYKDYVGPNNTTKYHVAPTSTDPHNTHVRHTQAHTSGTHVRHTQAHTSGTHL